VLTDVTTDIVITKEKTFSLVAPFYRFKTEQDAVTSSRVLRSRGAEAIIVQRPLVACLG